MALRSLVRSILCGVAVASAQELRGSGAARSLSNDLCKAVVGGMSTAVVRADGSVWTVGENFDGQLATGDNNDRSTLQEVAAGARSAAMGAYHTVVLKADGSVWTAGFNFFGQLADGRSMSRNTLQQVMTEVQAVAAGTLFTALLKRDGTVWTAGDNVDGQLADGAIRGSRATFKQVLSVGQVQAIAAGGSHLVALRADGSVLTAGNNRDGQLLDGLLDGRTATRAELLPSAAREAQAIAAGLNHTVVLYADGSVGTWGDGQPAARSLAGGARAVAAGQRHTLVLMQDGSMLTAGSNRFGQLGDETFIDRPLFEQVLTGVRSMATGSYATHSLVVKTDSTIWGVGSDAFGQLANGESRGRLRSTFQQVAACAV